MSSSSSKQMSPKMKFFFARIFPLIFIVVGASVAFFGIRGLVRAKASLDWPTVQGKVVESSVERHQGSTARKRRSSTTYHAKVSYEFIVDGTTFNGDRVAYGDYGSNNSSHAQKVVNRYPKGKSVSVHYMPENPKECLLEPGLKGQAWLMPGIGLVFFVIGSLMVVFLPKAIRKQKVIE